MKKNLEEPIDAAKPAVKGKLARARPAKRVFREFGSQESLIETAKIISARIFPPGENHSNIYVPKDGRNYFYFPAIDYFEYGRITPDLIHKLQLGGTMLSVGSGDGHLERLISGFGIAPERISVSDIQLDPDLHKYGFKTYEFDMSKAWPQFDEKFDYIIFPESLGVATMHLGDKITFRFFDHINEEAQRILRGEETKHGDLFMDIIQMDVPAAGVKYSIIAQALSKLKSGGEIRVFYGLHQEQQRAYVINRLRKENYGVDFFSQRCDFKIRLL